MRWPLPSSSRLYGQAGIEGWVWRVGVADNGGVWGGFSLPVACPVPLPAHPCTPTCSSRLSDRFAAAVSARSNPSTHLWSGRQQSAAAPGAPTAALGSSTPLPALQRRQATARAAALSCQQCICKHIALAVHVMHPTRCQPTSPPHRRPPPPTCAALHGLRKLLCHTAALPDTW